MSGAVEALAAQFRPSRLNFAGVCLWCEQRWCQSTACVNDHDASLWAPCPDCAGFGCCATCLNGVVEVDQAGLVELAGRDLPRRPRIPVAA